MSFTIQGRWGKLSFQNLPYFLPPQFLHPPVCFFKAFWLFCEYSLYIFDILHYFWGILEHALNRLRVFLHLQYFSYFFIFSMFEPFWAFVIIVKAF